jgi:hypothetical protein
MEEKSRGRSIHFSQSLQGFQDLLHECGTEVSQALRTTDGLMDWDPNTTVGSLVHPDPKEITDSKLNQKHKNHCRDVLI